MKLDPVSQWKIYENITIYHSFFRMVLTQYDPVFDSVFDSVFSEFNPMNDEQFQRGGHPVSSVSARGRCGSMLQHVPTRSEAPQEHRPWMPAASQGLVKICQILSDLVDLATMDLSSWVASKKDWLRQHDEQLCWHNGSIARISWLFTEDI
jgi:hypothetical protein